MKKIIFIIAISLISLTACDKAKEKTDYQSNDNNRKKDIIIESKQKINSKRVALLIANEDYKNQNKLRNPINDLTLIKTKLQNLGYVVTPLTDSTKKEMFRAIEKFGKDAKNADSAIFYYSGHGVQDKARRNFLIPVNAKITSNADIESDSVDAYKVIEALREAKPRLSLVLFDACRNNPNDNTQSYYQSRGSSTFGNKDYDTGNKLLISYATQNGYVALDGQGKNSPYALALANQLEQAENKSLLVMFDEITEDVMRATNNEQNPTRVNKNVKVKNKLFSSHEENRKSPIVNITKKGLLNRFDKVGTFSEGFTAVQKNGKWGFVDKTEKVIIPFQYDYVARFKEGLAGVNKDGKWGYINQQGEIVIPLQYDNAWWFENGKAKVEKGGEVFYLNKQGK